MPCEIKPTVSDTRAPYTSRDHMSPTLNIGAEPVPGGGFF